MSVVRVNVKLVLRADISIVSFYKHTFGVRNLKGILQKGSNLRKRVRGLWDCEKFPKESSNWALKNKPLLKRRAERKWPGSQDRMPAGGGPALPALTGNDLELTP